MSFSITHSETNIFNQSESDFNKVTEYLEQYNNVETKTKLKIYIESLKKFRTFNNNPRIQGIYEEFFTKECQKIPIEDQLQIVLENINYSDNHDILNFLEYFFRFKENISKINLHNCMCLLSPLKDLKIINVFFRESIYENTEIMPFLLYFRQIIGKSSDLLDLYYEEKLTKETLLLYASLIRSRKIDLDYAIEPILKFIVRLDFETRMKIYEMINSQIRKLILPDDSPFSVTTNDGWVEDAYLRKLNLFNLMVYIYCNQYWHFSIPIEFYEYLENIFSFPYYEEGPRRLNIPSETCSTIAKYILDSIDKIKPLFIKFPENWGITSKMNTGNVFITRTTSWYTYPKIHPCFYNLSFGEEEEEMKKLKPYVLDYIKPILNFYFKEGNYLNRIPLDVFNQILCFVLEIECKTKNEIDDVSFTTEWSNNFSKTNFYTFEWKIEK